MGKIVGTKLDPQKWIEIEDSDCTFQNRSHRDVYFQFDTDTPTNRKDCFTAKPLEIYEYVNDSDKLYAFNPEDTYCILAVHKNQ